MTRTELIDHLRAGRPITAKVVKEIVAELEFSRKQDAELKRLLAMQSDLDLQGYEHMRGELQELRGWFRGRPSKKIMKAISHRAEATCQNTPKRVATRKRDNGYGVITEHDLD